MTAAIEKINLRTFFLCIICLMISMINSCSVAPAAIRSTENFGRTWKFHLGDVANGYDPALEDSAWRIVNLPHDWSIEGKFSNEHPATPGGGALPGGIGWYRKSFSLPETERNRLVFISFDGVYRNSEVWINGHYLGERPYGYISFQYALTPYLNYGNISNTIAVRVDNSQQPNSRWYSGSGIYRNVWLTITEKVYVEHWGTFVSTPQVDPESTRVTVNTTIRNATEIEQPIMLTTSIIDDKGNEVARMTSEENITRQMLKTINHELQITNPNLWSTENPVLYEAVSIVSNGESVCDIYKTSFGIRSFSFNAEKGFFLNGKHTKIKGVCNHHDLGCLGAAVNTRAIERQLQILKKMGCNGIRTSHNPPAPELLTLCDRMGFIVMNEAFDMWEKGKTEYDYHLDFAEWHERDMTDFVLRDRNHPSVFIWSIGNEIMEQWDKQDSSGSVIANRLTQIIKKLDNTRPVTAGCNDIDPLNPLIRSGALDIIGYNYHHEKYVDFPQTYPSQILIASETESALATRGSYDMPSDSIRRWPPRWDLPLETGNPDFTCSSYDNCSAPWGSTHEETWELVKKYDFVSGLFTWTGFDYLGEPTPYGWPARSSYFGIIDLAGFPKDSYYLYQSQWTDKNVLHLFPHWNWEKGQTIDVWVYSNCEEVELFLNEKSMGIKKVAPDSLRAIWHLVFQPGTIKAVGRNSGKDVLTKEIRTAGPPAKIEMKTDREVISADGRDLAFVTVKLLDEKGTMVPSADNMIHFKIHGKGRIIAVDNGLQTSHEPFQADFRKAFHGMCLAVIQSDDEPGTIELEATSDGIEKSTITIITK